MLVDTSVWIDYFNGYPLPQADGLAEAIDTAAPIVIPGIVLTEVLLGLRSEAEANRIANLLSAFDPAPAPVRGDYNEDSEQVASLYRRVHWDPLDCRRALQEAKFQRNLDEWFSSRG